MSWELEDSAKKERQGKEQGFPLKTEATAQSDPFGFKR